MERVNRSIDLMSHSLSLSYSLWTHWELSIQHMLSKYVFRVDHLTTVEALLYKSKFVIRTSYPPPMCDQLLMWHWQDQRESHTPAHMKGTLFMFIPSQTKLETTKNECHQEPCALSLTKYQTRIFMMEGSDQLPLLPTDIIRCRQVLNDLSNNDTSTCAQVSVAYSGVTEVWKEVP
jgi:hypothetical protein